ncbi:hypothetical protein [Chryseobacterium sp. MMS23-Vi53]|uniref:hypothetical protein n=1 Tax=Chryseobacterium sp. MMS23-Vi53 TaxID=3386644 RepID=UPI0039E77859
MDKISERFHKIESYCKEKSGRKLQKSAIPIREAVVVIKEDTTMQDLHDLYKRLEEELKIRIFQIAIHKDDEYLKMVIRFLTKYTIQIIKIYYLLFRFLLTLI